MTDPDIPPEYRADPDEGARIAGLVRRWAQAITTALAAAGEAQKILGDLERCDGELSESGAATDAREGLAAAWHRLYAAGDIALARLKLITDAEKDTELERLRAEVGQLRRRLADHACGAGGEPAGMAGSAAPAECAHCGIPVTVTAAGFWSADGTDDRAAITCDESPDNRHAEQLPDPAEGEGPDLD
jgi:hypothetical protein